MLTLSLLFGLFASAFSHDEVRCNSCQSLIETVKSGAGSSVLNRDEVLSYLSSLPQHLKSQCDNLIDEEQETVADLLMEKYTPEQVCAIVGECDIYDSMFVTMTNHEKRVAVANKISSREGKNQYTQDSRRTQVGSGYSDCSSLVWWGYKEAVGLEVGGNTEAQMLSGNMHDAGVSISNGIPNESQMLVGDQLYFRGTDTSRSKSKYVGHVETYIGNGQLMGHGSGVGPTRKNMKDYCKSRQSQSSPVPGGNRGLISVKRGIVKDSTN